MRDAIRDLVDAAVQSLQAEGVLPSGLPEVQIERGKPWLFNGAGIACWTSVMCL